MSVCAPCAKLVPMKSSADSPFDPSPATLSGMFSAEPLNCTIAALGADRVMFSADYPFEQIDEAGEFMDHVPLDETLREDIAYNNAMRLLRLKP